MSAKDYFSQSHHADSSPHSPLLRPWRGHEGASSPASTVVDIDGEDSSETESVTVKSRPSVIYTPTSSQARSDGTISADEESTMGERESLLATDPSQYEDIPPPAEPAFVRRDDGLKCCLEDNAAGINVPHEKVSEQALPTVSNSSNRGKRRRCCRREKRSKGRRGCVFLKVATFLGLAIYFIAKFTFHYRRQIPVYTSERPGQVPPRPEREIVVHNSFHSIKGRWPLYDLLSLTTTHGSIAVTIEPQPADPDDPDKPARVILETQTGSIAVSFSVSQSTSFSGCGNDDNDDGDDELEPRQRKNKRDFRPGCRRGNQKRQYYYAEGHHIDGSSEPFPARPYEVEIRTQAGSISGRVIFTTHARIESTAGSITASLTPVVYAGSSSNKDISIHTRTLAGSQHIQITEPHIIRSPDDCLSKEAFVRSPTSSHSAITGGISITYPRSWAGRVQASSWVGYVRLEGDGLQVTRDGNGLTGIKTPSEDGGRGSHKWWGSRGDMNASLAVTGAGAIHFVVE